MSPASDDHPPRLVAPFDLIWEEPVRLPGPVNSAGAEDSSFITPDGEESNFWFTPDMHAPLAEPLHSSTQV
jgi:hypothetical protein